MIFIHIYLCYATCVTHKITRLTYQSTLAIGWTGLIYPNLENSASRLDRAGLTTVAVQLENQCHRYIQRIRSDTPTPSMIISILVGASHFYTCSYTNSTQQQEIVQAFLILLQPDYFALVPLIFIINCTNEHLLAQQT